MSGNTVDVAVAGIPTPRWKSRLARFCLKALEAAGADGWELSVLLCDDGLIRSLNARYRSRDRPTDVLSFSQREGHSSQIAREGAGASCAGDLVISLETLRRNAASHGVGEEEELRRLVVHGLLHLDGMEHGRGRGRAMLDRQRAVLTALADERITAGEGRLR